MSTARVAPAMNVAGARKSSFSGKAINSRSVSMAPRARVSLTVRAADAAPAKAEKAEEKPWSPPKLNPNTPSPIFGGSTGGLLRKAQVRVISGVASGRRIAHHVQSWCFFPTVTWEQGARDRQRDGTDGYFEQCIRCFTCQRNQTRQAVSVTHRAPPSDRVRRSLDRSGQTSSTIWFGLFWHSMRRCSTCPRD
mgnify:FL=1